MLIRSHTWKFSSCVIKKKGQTDVHASVISWDIVANERAWGKYLIHIYNDNKGVLFLSALRKTLREGSDVRALSSAWQPPPVELHHEFSRRGGFIWSAEEREQVCSLSGSAPTDQSGTPTQNNMGVSHGKKVWRSFFFLCSRVWSPALKIILTGTANLLHVLKLQLVFTSPYFTLFQISTFHTLQNKPIIMYIIYAPLFIEIPCFSDIFCGCLLFPSKQLIPAPNTGLYPKTGALPTPEIGP